MKEDPRGCSPRGSFCGALLDHLDVVATRLHVVEERGEHRALDHMGPAPGALAIADGDLREVRGDLHAAAVPPVASPGFSPDRSRQVDHCSLHLLSKLPEIERGIGWLKGRVADPAESSYIGVHLCRAAHLLDRV